MVKLKVLLYFALGSISRATEVIIVKKVIMSIMIEGGNVIGMAVAF